MEKSHSGIDDLPVEVIVKVFDSLTLHEIFITCSNVSSKWQGIVALSVLRPKMSKLSKVNQGFRMMAEKQGWSSECEDVELILSLYSKYEYFSSKLKN